MLSDKLACAAQNPEHASLLTHTHPVLLHCQWWGMWVLKLCSRTCKPINTHAPCVAALPAVGHVGFEAVQPNMQTY